LARQSRYPEEFRRQAAALVLDSGRTIRDVGRELGVNHETLHNWVDKLRQERNGSPAAAGLSSDERAELLRPTPAGRSAGTRERDPEKAMVFLARETRR
jgi:transposase